MVVPHFGDEADICPQALCCNGLIRPFPSEESGQTCRQYRLSGMMESWNLEDEIDVGIPEDQNFASHELTPNRSLRFRLIKDQPYRLED